MLGLNWPWPNQTVGRIQAAIDPPDYRERFREFSPDLGLSVCRLSCQKESNKRSAASEGIG